VKPSTPNALIKSDITVFQIYILRENTWFESIEVSSDCQEIFWLTISLEPLYFSISILTKSSIAITLKSNDRSRMPCLLSSFEVGLCIATEKFWSLRSGSRISQVSQGMAFSKSLTIKMVLPINIDMCMACGPNML
jgi:hypothetical protein